MQAMAAIGMYYYNQFDRMVSTLIDYSSDHNIHGDIGSMTSITMVYQNNAMKERIVKRPTNIKYLNRDNLVRFEL